MSLEYDALLDWLGSGGQPVSPELAEKRASICASCPLNVQPGWWEKNLKEPIAQAIVRTLELKHSMKITTSLDGKLAMCQGCGCVNSLHVHAPLSHIIGHTKMQTMARFDPQCWILKGDKI